MRTINFLIDGRISVSSYNAGSINVEVSLEINDAASIMNALLDEFGYALVLDCSCLTSLQDLKQKIDERLELL